MAGFIETFRELPLAALVRQSLDTTGRTLEPLLQAGRARTLADFAALLSPAAGERIEDLARLSRRLTQKHFGKVIRLFAPLYLSNECVNACRYCGFARDNPIPRKTLSLEEALEEARVLERRGFRSVLLAAGEHPKYVKNGYIAECVRRCLPLMPGIALEIGALETDEYKCLVQAGAEGLVLYQETYHEPSYRELHPAGPKKDFLRRLDTPERAYAAGFRRIGIGPLYGLYDWRYDALAAAAHARYLTQRCWRAQITASFARLRPSAGGFRPDPAHGLNDRDLAQLFCAFRLFLPHAGLVLTTRERPHLRDGLIPLGVTHMSCGSCTEPGGYRHFEQTAWSPPPKQEGEQFHIADERPPAEVAAVIRRRGYEPVWKDFDRALVSQTALK